jgi:hypothetical protein
MKAPSERTEQLALARWLDLTGALWCHVGNERKCSPMQGAMLKALGVKAGIPDVLIFTPPPKASWPVGIAIELKSKSKSARVSDGQRSWLERLSACDWLTFVCHGADEAIRNLERLGYGPTLQRDLTPMAETVTLEMKS